MDELDWTLLTTANLAGLLERGMTELAQARRRAEPTPTREGVEALLRRLGAVLLEPAAIASVLPDREEEGVPLTGGAPP